MIIIDPIIQNYKQSHPRVGKTGLVGVTPALPDIAKYIVDPLGNHPFAHIPNPKINWPSLGNINHGDCVFASFGTITNATDIALGRRRSVSSAATIVAYQSYCNKYMGGKDAGSYPLQVLDLWTKAPMWGSTLIAYASVDLADIEALKSCIFHFGGVSVSCTLYESTVQQYMNKQPWTPDTPLASDKVDGGHEISLIGYDEKWFYAETWGRIVRIDPGWLRLINVGGYVNGNTIFITPVVAVAKAFRHVNLPELITDMKNVTSA